MRIPEFKIRASGIGQIMTDPVGKSPMQIYTDAKAKLKKDQERYDSMKTKDGPGGLKLSKSISDQKESLPELKAKSNNVILSETTKTYCQNWLKMILYNRRKNISSKHTEKGHIMEDDAIDFVARHLDMGMLLKNEISKEDDYKRGTCDVDSKANSLIIDVKNSWDPFTFPLFETECPNPVYWWQGQGYMDLYDRDHFKLVYTLQDTPMHLIQRECFFYCKNNGMMDDYDDVLVEFVQKMTYDDIPEDLKIKIFDIERDPGSIDRVHERVEECRSYIKDLYNGIDQG